MEQGAVPMVSAAAGVYILRCLPPLLAPTGALGAALLLLLGAAGGAGGARGGGGGGGGWGGGGGGGAPPRRWSWAWCAGLLP